VRVAAVAIARAISLLAVLPGGARADTLRLAPDAEVHSIDVRFEGPHELQSRDLLPALALSAPGTLDGLQRAFAWVPFIPDPPRHPFDPVALQSDLVRLRRLYRREGFLEARLDYEVKADAAARRVDILYRVNEGPALQVRSLNFSDHEGHPTIDLPESLRTRFEPAWKKLQETGVGRRFTEKQLDDSRGQAMRFFGNCGYPFASVEPKAAIDSTLHQVDLVWVIDTGPRVRVGSLEVDGARSVTEKIVTREMPLRPGDWVSYEQMEEGRSNIQSVALFRRASVSIPADTTAATTLPLRISVAESHPRLTNLEIGYVTDGAGLSGQTRWTHPNLTGGARSFDVVGLVQTGLGTTSDVPDRLARLTLSLTQPYVVSPRLSLTVGPLLEYRDGSIDRSGAWSALATLVYRITPLQSAALRYDYTYRKLDELRIAGIPAEDIPGLVGPEFGSAGLLDSLQTPTRTSQFIFFTSLGRLDDISRPRHGFVMKPNLAVTFPPGGGNVEFARADIQGTTFVPMPGRANALMLRGSLGGLWPFGGSIPASGENPAVDWFQLRDQVLTAGGANDVRGYDSRLLGPKIPQIDATVANGDTVISSDHYVAVGGLRRFTASAELRLGLPWISRDVFAHVFGDAGRVWTTDSRFRLAAQRADEDRVFYTTGGGIGYYTPVGAIRFDVGYKLNPSTFDQRRPEDVLNALLAGKPASDAPVDGSRRFVLHLSLGLFF
jgi:outer membrane protein insertion porin family